MVLSFLCMSNADMLQGGTFGSDMALLKELLDMFLCFAEAVAMLLHAVCCMQCCMVLPHCLFLRHSCPSDSMDFMYHEPATTGGKDWWSNFGL